MLHSKTNCVLEPLFLAIELATEILILVDFYVYRFPCISTFRIRLEPTFYPLYMSLCLFKTFFFFNTCLYLMLFYNDKNKACKTPVFYGYPNIK